MLALLMQNYGKSWNTDSVKVSRPHGVSPERLGSLPASATLPSSSGVGSYCCDTEKDQYRSHPASWRQGMRAIWEGAHQEKMTWPKQRATGTVQGPVRHGASSGWQSWPWKFEAPASALKQDTRQCSHIAETRPPCSCPLLPWDGLTKLSTCILHLLCPPGPRNHSVSSACLGERESFPLA